MFQPLAFQSTWDGRIEALRNTKPDEVWNMWFLGQLTQCLPFHKSPQDAASNWAFTMKTQRFTPFFLGVVISMSSSPSQAAFVSAITRVRASLRTSLHQVRKGQNLHRDKGIDQLVDGDRWKAHRALSAVGQDTAWEKASGAIYLLIFDGVCSTL